MKPELQNKLQEKYPDILPGMWGDPRKTGMAFGIECGDGWYDILDELMGKIKEVDPEGKTAATQIKEKFGSLRFYYFYEGENHDEVNDLIVAAEAKSEGTCENCGKPGRMRSHNSWVVTLCDGCESGRKESE